MREDGIRAQHNRRWRATTDSRHTLPVAPNRLERNFTPAVPDLAIVLDLFNPEVVGWSIRPRMTSDIVTEALTMAWFRRKPTPG